VDNRESKSRKYSTCINGSRLDLNAVTHSDRHSMHKLTSNGLNARPSYRPVSVPCMRSFDWKSDRAHSRPHPCFMHRTFAMQIRFHRTYCKFVPYAYLASSHRMLVPRTVADEPYVAKNRARLFSRFSLFRRPRRRPSREVNCILNF